MAYFCKKMKKIRMFFYKNYCKDEKSVIYYVIVEYRLESGF